MAPPRLDQAALQAAVDAFATYGTQAEAAASLGLVRCTFQGRYQEAMRQGFTPRPADRPIQFDPVEIPSGERSVEQIVRAAIEKHDCVAQHQRAKRNVVIPIKCHGPIGIAFVPDRHMDSPGTHLGQVFDHAKLMAKTDGLFINDLGDSIDNFIVGKLERARRDHAVTITEAWILVEEYFRLVKDRLLAAISGNQLDWTTAMGGVDCLKKRLEKAGCHALYDADELMYRIKLPNGMIFPISLRHFFSGNSMWNAAHAVARYVQSAAYRDEIVVAAGHLHIAGYQIVEAHGKVCHCIQTGSYKDRDLAPYCRQKAFMRQHAFKIPMVTFFPEDCQGNKAGSSVFFPEIECGIPYLNWLRSKK